MSAKRYLARVGWEKIKSLMLVLLMLAAAVYIFTVFFGDIDSLKNALKRISIWNVLAAIVVAMPMYGFKAVYHYYSLNRISLAEVEFSTTVVAYLQAQVVRYLPGKIWGLVYQVKKSGADVSSSQVVMANVFQMVSTNFLAIGLVFLLVAASVFKLPLFYIFIPIVFLLVEANHRTTYVERKTILVLEKLIPRVRGKLNIESQSIKYKATSLLCIEWVFYFCTFVALLTGGYSFSVIYEICIWYSAASLVSIVFIFMPAGIIVREAFFISSASFFSGSEADMLVVASLLRLVWVVAELCTAFVASYYFGGRKCE